LTASRLQRLDASIGGAQSAQGSRPPPGRRAPGPAV